MIIDPAAGSWNDAYRWITGTVIPRPIAFVSTVSADGVVNIAPYSFFTVVCANPLTLCFAPMRKGPDAVKKDTLINIEQTGEFVVNVVDERFIQAMNLTSAEFPPQVDEFGVAGLTAAPSEVVRAPRVLESPINAECKLSQVVEVSSAPGGGSLVLGQVVRLHVRDDLIQEDAIVPGDAWHPVARCGGITYARLTDTFELSRPHLSDQQRAQLTTKG
jgi:flavin reductase (DIM6/NTAB) family NADH-FMN oxidoreductase RutF